MEGIEKSDEKLPYWVLESLKTYSEAEDETEEDRRLLVDERGCCAWRKIPCFPLVHLAARLDSLPLSYTLTLAAKIASCFCSFDRYSVLVVGRSSVICKI